MPRTLFLVNGSGVARLKRRIDETAYWLHLSKAKVLPAGSSAGSGSGGTQDRYVVETLQELWSYRSCSSSSLWLSSSWTRLFRCLLVDSAETVEGPQLQLFFVVVVQVLDKVFDVPVVVQRQGFVETVLKTVEVRSCSSSTRWPSSVTAAWRWVRLGDDFLGALEHSQLRVLEGSRCTMSTPMLST